MAAFFISGRVFFLSLKWFLSLKRKLPPTCQGRDLSADVAVVYSWNVGSWTRHLVEISPIFGSIWGDCSGQL